MDPQRRTRLTMSAVPREVRVQDLRAFSAIVRCGSIRGAARQLGTTPSQVSKAVVRLERQWRLSLLIRGDRGVAISEAGKGAAQRVDAVLADIGTLADGDPTLQRYVTVAGAAFLNQVFLASLAGRLGNVRMRSIELPPALASAYASADLFSVALTVTEELWPQAWSKLLAGNLRYQLFASPRGARAIGPTPATPQRIRKRVFLTPIYAHNGQVVPGNDGCPLGLGERILGHQTQSLALALEIAARTDELIFAPRMAARPYLSSGSLVEVPVRGWKVVRPLWLVCHGERVTSHLRREIVNCLRESLAE